jgi:hypothetical protein
MATSLCKSAPQTPYVGRLHSLDLQFGESQPPEDPKIVWLIQEAGRHCQARLGVAETDIAVGGVFETKVQGILD